jgi:hypothetical protein
MKSALELALERASSLQIDEKIILQEESYRVGSLLAGTLYKSGIETFVQQWQALPAKTQAEQRIGLLRSLFSNIALPQSEEYLVRSRLAGQALLCMESKLEVAVSALDALLSSYSAQHATFMENLTKQLEQHLAQKKHYLPLNKQSQEVLADPELASIYADETKKFQLYFEEHLHQHKWQILQILQVEPNNLLL